MASDSKNPHPEITGSGTWGLRPEEELTKMFLLKKNSVDAGMLGARLRRWGAGGVAHKQECLCHLGRGGGGFGQSFVEEGDGAVPS